MAKPLTKVWSCPTCSVRYMASEAREGSAVGRRCPNGHFHSYYELRRHEDGKPIRVQRVEKPKDKPKKFVMVDRHGGSNAGLLAILWVDAIDRVLAQMPKGSRARQMVEGATAQAYRVSQQILKPETAERKAA